MDRPRPVTIPTVWLDDQKIWWDAPNSVRIPTAIVVALAVGLRVYGVYQSSKNTPRRSPKVRRIERIIGISLWIFIAVGVTLLLIFRR
jgi:cobalamin biosynthesis protein CobD/CbiB